MNTKEKIGIIGLGPIGLMLAVFLKKSGHEVVLCDKDKLKLGLIKSEGVSIKGIFNENLRFTELCDSIADFKIFKPEIVIFSTKSYQTPSAAKEVKNSLGNIVVISAQNGIDVEEILIHEFSADNVLRLVINFAGNNISPNCINATFFNSPNYLASINDAQKELAVQLAHGLSINGLKTEAVSSTILAQKVWEKTILNASLSVICGLGKMTITEAMSIPDTLEIIQQVIEEAIEVAAAENITYPDDFVKSCLSYLKNTGNHYPSLAIDLMNNRPTEIDYMNGKVVQYGRKHCISTPLNLMLTNMVKAMSQRNSKAALSDIISIKPLNNGMPISNETGLTKTKAYLGIDLGSSYTKICLINEQENVVYSYLIKTVNREKISVKHLLQLLNEQYEIKSCCATGYGRKHFQEADLIKTEINCAARGAQKYLNGSKCIIDIGGEDIKVIRCNENNLVENFYLNDKCAAGTGSFITEIAEKAGISIPDMSMLAKQTQSSKELNSFCTVFAKTEIMSWMFEGTSLAEIARGVYVSTANRVSKIRIDSNVPILLIGGVISYHPYFKTILEEKIKSKVEVAEMPQFVVAYGAALMARDYCSTEVN